MEFFDMDMKCGWQFSQYDLMKTGMIHVHNGRVCSYDIRQNPAVHFKIREVRILDSDSTLFFHTGKFSSAQQSKQFCGPAINLYRTYTCPLLITSETMLFSFYPEVTSLINESYLRLKPRCRLTFFTLTLILETENYDAGSREFSTKNPCSYKDNVISLFNTICANTCPPFFFTFLMQRDFQSAMQKYFVYAYFSLKSAGCILWVYFMPISLWNTCVFCTKIHVKKSCVE